MNDKNALEISIDWLKSQNSESVLMNRLMLIDLFESLDRNARQPRFSEAEREALQAILVHAMGSYNVFVEALKTATEVQQSEKDRLYFLTAIATVRQMLGKGGEE